MNIRFSCCCLNGGEWIADLCQQQLTQKGKKERLVWWLSILLSCCTDLALKKKKSSGLLHHSPLCLHWGCKKYIWTESRTLSELGWFFLSLGLILISLLHFRSFSRTDFSWWKSISLHWLQWGCVSLHQLMIWPVHISEITPNLHSCKRRSHPRCSTQVS